MIETKLVGTISMLLIIVNLVCLYFIVDLYSYDEITGYLSNGGLKSCSTRGFVLLLFTANMANLLFVCLALLARHLNRYPEA